MPSKKVNAASIAPPPVSDASETVVKKTRKKVVAAAPVAKKEKSVKAAAPRKRTAPAKKAAATANTSIVNLSDALESPQSLDVKDIEVRAYLSWLERGCPEGSPQEDWYRAERELMAMSAGAGR